MASIEDGILTAIKVKGSIFFPSDFTSYGYAIVYDIRREAIVRRIDEKDVGTSKYISQPIINLLAQQFFCQVLATIALDMSFL